MHANWLIPTVLVLTTATGCLPTTTPADDASFDRSARTATANSCNDAIEILASTTNDEEAGRAHEVLFNAGIVAIHVLSQHLSDRRQIPSKFDFRQMAKSEQLAEIGEYSFWVIEAKLEPSIGKLYDGKYSNFDRTTLAEWLNSRSGYTLSQLQLDALSYSLELAELDLKTNGAETAREAVALYRRRMNILTAKADQ